MRTAAYTVSLTDPNNVLIKKPGAMGMEDFEEVASLAGTEPRWLVGFEVVLGALFAAFDGGVFFSIHAGVELRHGLFG